MKNQKINLDSLAGMVKTGFDEIGDKLKNLRKQNAEEHKQNTREHEEIKMRLDNVAYRFELVELQKRVELLEKKVLKN